MSIITPLYNSESYITRTIESVLAQTYKNWELIIVDDCSTDNGLTIAKSYAAKDDRISVLENKINSGAGISRNSGIAVAKGQFIAFLDSDDEWYPAKLERQIMFMKRNNYDLSFTYYERRGEDGEMIDVIDEVPDKVSYGDVLKKNWMGCLTVIYNVEAIGKHYMPDIRKRQDHALWLKILKIIDYAYCLNEPLAIYTVRKDSISNNKLNVIKYQWALYSNVENLSLIKSVKYMLTWAFYGIKKSIF